MTNEIKPSPLRPQPTKEETAAVFADIYAVRAKREAERPHIQREGEAALSRLFKVASGDSGQCRHIARFLLGLYNGNRFPFDMTRLRAIDFELFDDCLAVLKMDAFAVQEVHRYFADGGKAFEALVTSWNVLDIVKLQQAARDAGIDVQHD